MALINESGTIIAPVAWQLLFLVDAMVFLNNFMPNITKYPSE
jgi:hypothetical protein